jgi:hypothetical protein
MSKDQALATWKSIMRNHPFFQDGGKYGFDFPTMHACGYGRTATILKECIRIAQVQS